MRMLTLFLSVVISSFLGHVLSNACGHYNTWNPKGINRTDLKCPDWCNIDPTESSVTYDDCCVCRAKPSWAVCGGTILLKLEYTRRDGSSNIFGNKIMTASFIHTNGFLSRFPRNVCDFMNIVEIILTYNSLSRVGNISCLKSLDTLDLSYNRIEYIERGAFTELSNLRVLKLVNNGLNKLDPFTITGTTLGIFWADFSFNNLSKIDVSNIVPENDFCQYDFSSNNITEIVNTDNFTLDVNKTYQGGFVDLDKNSFTKFIDYSDFGVDNITILGKVLNFGFSFLDVKWDCDCQMEPYLELFEDILNKIWRNYFNIKCWNPREYRGKSVPEFFVRKDNLDLLICNMSSAEKCPRECFCYYQPKLRRTVVNCTSVGLTKLPDYMPTNNNLTILLSNNSIHTFENRDYMNRTFLLDVSNNSITSFSNDSLNLLNTNNITINLENNRIIELPRDLQQFDPCSVALGMLTISCGCKDVWIKDWVTNKKAERCSNVTELYCITSKGIVSTLTLTREDICEIEGNILFRILTVIFSVCVAVVILVASLLYMFRYELFVLNRSKVNNKSSQIGPTLLYDVFLSFNEENRDVLLWVTNTLEPILKRAGYKSFISLRDSTPGVNRVEELIGSINSSRNSIVVLCESYLNEYWKKIEWSYLWKNYSENTGRKVIIVNFDQLESSEVQDLKLRAFLRLSQDLDFADKKHRLFKDIQLRLGSPIRSECYDKSAKTRFIVNIVDLTVHI